MVARKASVVSAADEYEDIGLLWYEDDISQTTSQTEMSDTDFLWTDGRDIEIERFQDGDIHLKFEVVSRKLQLTDRNVGYRFFEEVFKKILKPKIK